MREITVEELKQKIDNQEDFQLVDVRAAHERADFNIGGDHIPMGIVSENIGKFDKEKEVIVYCRSGNRSGQVINFLAANYGFTNLINLKGGMLAWADHFGDQ